MMQLHELQKNSTSKRKKRVGRGGKKGTYCGGGGKGQKGRAGAKFKPLIREWIKKYPKLRGYNFNVRGTASVINLDVLESSFEANAIVSPEILVAKRIVRNVNGIPPVVKILSVGEIKKALIVENCKVSKIAKDKIEKAGGTVKTKEPKVKK
jgi:large subunit ribosomal protein L15